jgi:GT2 family glycosyltransferase
VYEEGLVSVVVVNYRTDRYLDECLRSVQQQDYGKLELILVNNASPDFASEALDRFKPEVFINNAKNTGFARANNQAILKARGEYVLLLNADAKIPPDFVRDAVSEFARDSTIGTVVPRIVRWDNPDIVESTGHLLRTDFTAAHRDRGLHIVEATHKAGYVLGGTAACIVYRREMLEDVRYQDEYFDESFFAYFEDVDFDVRAQLAGYKAWHQPELAAEHIGGGSGQRRSARLQLIAEKNRYLALAKWLTMRDWLPNLPAIVAYEAYHFLRTLLRPYLFLALFGYLYFLPSILRKRMRLQRRRTLSPQEFRPMLTPRFGAATVQYQRCANSDEYPVTVSVIVINYNGLEHTRGCLDALSHQSFADFETIVVDNGSDGDEGKILRHEHPEANVLLAGTNTGFAGGVNLGYAAARGRYAVLLNNDAEPEPEFLAELVRAMDHTGADAGCGTLIEEGRAPTNDSLSVLGRNIPGVFGEESLTLYPSGGAAILRSASIETLGGKPFDPRYFIYHEDVSLGFRIRLAGGDIIKIPNARAKHLGGATTRSLPCAMVRYYQTRNRILNRMIYLESATLARIWPLCFFERIARWLRTLGSWDELRATLRVERFFLSNQLYIARERRRLGRLRCTQPLAKQPEEAVRDARFLPLLSGRINGRNGIADRLALAWLKLVRLPVRENLRDSL